MSIQLLLTIALFAVAVTSLYFNFRQHRQGVGEQRARAHFDVTVRTIDADERGIRWTDARTTTQYTRIAIGVKNTGDKPAGETVVNVVMPRNIASAVWTDAQGGERPGNAAPADTDEMLPDRHGNATVPSRYLASAWERIGLRSHYEKYVTFQVELPKSDARQTAVPIRVRVQADELPEDVDEYVIDYTVHVVRRPG